MPDTFAFSPRREMKTFGAGTPSKGQFVVCDRDRGLALPRALRRKDIGGHNRQLVGLRARPLKFDLVRRTFEVRSEFETRSLDRSRYSLGERLLVPSM